MASTARLRAALAVEGLKFRREPVVLIAKAGPAAANGGWNGLFAMADQVIPTAGLLGFGVVSGWV